MRIIIVGGGKTGSHLASVLAEESCVVRVIELDRRRAAQLEDELPAGTVVRGNGSSPEVLERAGAHTAGVVIAATGRDDINLVVSTLAKMEFGVERVVARVNDPANAWMFNESMGVDVGIDQAGLIARFVQEGLDLDDAFTIMRLGRDGHALMQVEVRPHSRVVGKTLRDVELPGQTILVAIERGGAVIVPKGDTQLEVGDHILSFTDAVGREYLRQALQ